MFRDWYKKANDDIQPDPALLERILMQKPRRRFSGRRLYPLGIAAAGVCIVSAAVLSYPVLRDVHKNKPSGILPPENAVVSSVAPAAAPDGSASPAALETDPPAKTQQPAQMPAGQKAEPAAKTRLPVKTTAPAEKTEAQTQKPIQTQQPVRDAAAQNAEAAGAPAKTQPPAKTEEPAAASLAADSPDQPTPTPAVKGVTSDQVELVSRPWTKADYAAYLGTDVEARLAVPADLENITPDTRNMSVDPETDVPYYDLWAYKYQSADGSRRLTVKTTKDRQNLPETAGETMDIGGMTAAVYRTETEMTADFHKDGIWYMVKAEGLSESEWMDACLSVCEEGEQK